jgi:succinate dehydrogenase/fumarate reductase-like Fe-S protein
MNCTETCPKNLNPAQSIFNIKKMISIMTHHTISLKQQNDFVKKKK